MRLFESSVEDPRGVDLSSKYASHGRRSRVRMSILSREMIVMIVLLGVVGSVTGLLQDGTPVQRCDQKTLRGHDIMIETLVYAPDGQTLISCGWDKQVRLWDVVEGQPGWGREIQTLHHDWHIFSAVTTPDGKYLAASGVGGLTIWARTPRSGWERIKEQTGLSCRSLAFSPDGNILAISSTDQTIRLWDMAAMKEMRQLGGFSDEVRAVEFSRDGALLAASTFRGELSVWNLRSDDQQPIKGGILDAVQSFAFVPGARTLAIAQSGKGLSALFLWSQNSGSPQSRISDNLAGNNALAVSADGRFLASADQDRSIRLWDLATGQLKGTLHEGVGWVKTLAFSPDGRRIAFGGQSGIVQFREVNPEGKPIELART